MGYLWDFQRLVRSAHPTYPLDRRWNFQRLVGSHSLHYSHSVDRRWNFQRLVRSAHPTYSLDRTLHTGKPSDRIQAGILVEPVVFVRRRAARDEIGDLTIGAPNLQRLSVVELSIREDEAVERGDVSR